MTAVAHKMEETGDGTRERRDIVSGEVLPDSRLIRFVADPDGNVVPDAGAKLPGRGLWVEASRDAVNKAVEKKLFSRAAKAPVKADADLSARAEKALVTRMLGLRNIDDMTPAAPDADAPAWARQAFTDKEGRRWKMLDIRELLADERFMDIGV